MKRWNKAAVLAAIVVLGAGMVGCGNREDKGTEVTVGYFNNITHAQALLLKAEGKLEQAFGDAKVKWTAFNAGPAEVEALFAGDIDIGYMGPVPAISANVKSAGDVRIISGATKAGTVLVRRKGAQIEDIRDLAGKVVAVPQMGNTQHLCLLDLLSENGLKPVAEGGDVTVTAVSNADVANTMERGDIDAAIVPEPWGATLLAGNAELVLDYDELYAQGEYDVALVVVREEFKEEHPELVEKFLLEHEGATAAINEGREEALKKINEELGRATGKSLSDEIIHQAFERIGVSTRLNRASIEGFASISKEQGFIKELPGADTLFTL